MTIKIISVGPLPQVAIKKIKNIYKESNNPNESLLNSIPEYKFSQGNSLYFCDLRTKNPNIEEIEI